MASQFGQVSSSNVTHKTQDVFLKKKLDSTYRLQHQFYQGFEKAQKTLEQTLSCGVWNLFYACMVEASKTSTHPLQSFFQISFYHQTTSFSTKIFVNFLLTSFTFAPLISVFGPLTLTDVPGIQEANLCGRLP